MAKEIKKAKVITPEQIQEQKRNQALAMLVQKRETFAVNILVSLCRGNGFAYPKDQDNFGLLVDLSVEMADRLLEKLYPVKEDKK